MYIHRARKGCIYILRERCIYISWELAFPVPLNSREMSYEAKLQKHPRIESALGTKRFVERVYDRARSRYLPKSIRLLFVAESPPSSGGFFYFTRTIGKDHLFRETMKALELWPISKPMVKGLDKRPLLDEFQSRGFFLVDTSPLPVDKLPPIERRLTILREAPGLSTRVEDLDPQAVAIVKKTVYAPVREALEKNGLGPKILNAGPIPFPSHGNQRRYRILLKRLIEKIGTD